jgi:general nucleoside transport system ATP-binding protein
MVGRDVLLRVEKGAATPAATVLDVSGFGVRVGDAQRVSDVSLTVRAGEIVGIAGVEGNGQTELVEALAGLIDRRNVTGRVTVGGDDITSLTPRQRRDRGIAHIPEDRHRRGLLLDFDLQENVILGSQHRKNVAGGAVLLDRALIRRRTDDVIQRFDVRPPNAELPARALSGGNQQKLIIGREVEERPRLLLVSQPTRGVDIGAIEFIHRKLIEMRDGGSAILLVSSELEEVTALADRLLVMRDGRIVGEVDPKMASGEQIGMLMTGGAHQAHAAAAVEGQ